MCGICGIYRADRGPVDVSLVEKMCDALSYRGPDGSGLSSGPGFALGHRRLAIIDLSEHASQPMKNEEGTVEVIFNGEIYNYKELTKTLQSKGHRFTSQSDTETMIHGYEEWGLKGLLATIRGMYAVAIIDHTHHVIHIARDPLGKKPLFFCIERGVMTFASSARALALGLDRTPEINPSAIDDLLWNLYIPGPQTIFSGIEKLSPGHALTLGADGKRFEFNCWSPDFLHANTDLQFSEWIEQVEATLRTAVRRRLVADVPVGVLLSGGVDSSLITALAAECHEGIQTFSVASEVPHLDESAFALEAAKHCGTKHHVLHVNGDIRKGVSRLIAAMGEPLSDASAANVFAIAEKAREYVTVVLTGDGGDESFGGYRTFLAHYVAGEVNRRYSGVLRLPLWLMTKLLWQGNGSLHALETLYSFSRDSFEELLLQPGMAMDLHTRACLYTPEFKERLKEHNPVQYFLDALPGSDRDLPVDRYMQAHMCTTLPDDYLTKVDNATMAVALEARCPLLDLEVVKLAMQIPAPSRFHRFRAKGLLCKIAERHVPRKCIWRRKRGFVAPVAKWLARDWTDLVDELILGPHLEKRRWFRRDTLSSLVAEHRNGIDHAYLLWSLMVLELWVRMSVDHTLQSNDII